MQYFKIPDTERKKICEFREYIQANGYFVSLPDEMLYRYLVTSNYRMAPALSKIIKMITWRNTSNINNLFQDVYAKQIYSILSKKLRFSEHGHDLLNRPLTIMAIGATDLFDILKDYEVEDIMLTFYYYTEYMEQKAASISRQLDRDYTGNVTIMDMKGLTLRKHLHPKAITIFKNMVLVNTYYYPESVQSIFVINSSPIFSYFWGLIHPFMNKMQYTKLTVLQDITELHKYFSPDQLPCQYGGTCKCNADHILFDEVPPIAPNRSGAVAMGSNGKGRLEQRVEEGDYFQISFSSTECDVYYNVFSENDNGDRHVYCQNHPALSNTSIVNLSFVIVSSGRFTIEFVAVDTQVTNCIVGYELNVN